MSLLSTIHPIIRSVFSRWTALQLAVSHSMGGPESEAKYEAFIDAFGDYLVKNVRILNENNVQDYLDEILDEEFNTNLDDGSSYELGQLFLRYIQLILQGKLTDVQQEIQMQQSTVSSTQMSIRNENNESSSSDESDDDEDDNMIEEEKPSKPQSMDVDEDGWTTVHRRK